MLIRVLCSGIFSRVKKNLALKNVDKLIAWLTVVNYVV